MLLKRPFSIHAVDRDEKTVTLIYQITGKGTEALTHTDAGTTDAWDTADRPWLRSVQKRK